jgi:hypothetical protein
LVASATRAFIERVGPRPGEGAVGAFQFGDCKGVVRGVLAAAAIPALFIQPAQWKRVVGVPPGKEGAKDAARAEAIRRWPDKAGLFRLVKDADKAEAALIGSLAFCASTTSSVSTRAPNSIRKRSRRERRKGSHERGHALFANLDP